MRRRRQRAGARRMTITPRTPRTLAVLALAALLATGCRAGSAGSGESGATPTPAAGATGTDPAAPAVGSSTQTITVDGRKRDFRVHRPASTSSTSSATTSVAGLPLVVMLHGGFGTASQAESSYGWDAEADAQHFVVVYPDGLDRAWNVDGGGCCGKPAQQGVDDVAFLSAVVRTVSAELPIDAHRVYATGISNGGIMAYRLACDTRLFAAIGPDSATLLGSCPSPTPISVIHIHGTADTRVPYDGGRGQGYAKIDGPPVPTAVANWRAVDGCAAPTAATTPATANAGAVTRSIAACPDGRAVELVTIAGAGHQWPGGVSKPVLEKVLGVSPPSKALNATDEIWRFFAAHARPAA
jgi:polyhydroxybutyrate depolymerase